MASLDGISRRHWISDVLYALPFGIHRPFDFLQRLLTYIKELGTIAADAGRPTRVDAIPEAILLPFPALPQTRPLRRRSFPTGFFSITCVLNWPTTLSFLLMLRGRSLDYMHRTNVY